MYTAKIKTFPLIRSAKKRICMVNSGSSTNFAGHVSRIYHLKAYICTQRHFRMTEETLHSVYQAVCDVPDGMVFQTETLPDLFRTDPLFDRPHVHTFYEIIWFFDDGGHHTVDFQRYAVQANSLFFLSPGQVHHFDGVTRHRGLTMKFCTNFLQGETSDEDVFLKYDAFNAFDKQPFFTVSDPEVTARLRRLTDDLQTEELHPDAFGHLDTIRSLLRLFLVQVHRHGTRGDLPETESANAAHRLFVRFRQQVERNFQRMHTVREYADALHVSSKTLGNRVTECSGTTALAFINSRILLEAKRMLRYTDLRVKEIAYRLGYEDPSYFVKFFKRQTGMLPVEFREAETRACGDA